MALIHHVVRGAGSPALVLVHGFSCDHTDWEAQVGAFAGRHLTVAVDLRGHGRSPGRGVECGIEAYGADVATVVRHLGLERVVVAGHSMGCRVALEVAMQLPERTAGVVLVDGSQFSAETEALVRRGIAAGELDRMITAMFAAMFNARSDRQVAEAIVQRAQRLPKDVAAQMSIDAARYDQLRLQPALAALAALAAPLLVIQSTYTNERRERVELAAGQSVPYLDMIRARVPGAQIEVMAGLGHFPQIDAPAEFNARLERFIARCR